MKHLSATLALAALAACGLAAAQTPPQSQSTPHSSYPSSTPPPSSTSGSESSSSSSSTSAKESRKQEMKDCMAQQEANNSGMSKSAMKKYCKDQVHGKSHESSSSPHQ